VLAPGAGGGLGAGQVGQSVGPGSIAAATDRARAATSRVGSQRSPRPANGRRASSEGSAAPPTAEPPRYVCTSGSDTGGPNRWRRGQLEPGESDTVNLCVHSPIVEAVRARIDCVASRGLGVARQHTEPAPLSPAIAGRGLAVDRVVAIPDQLSGARLRLPSSENTSS